jgi:hypothetical protein
MTDWKTIAAARGLHPTETELAKLALALDVLAAYDAPAYQALVANLTHEIEPATTVGEEAVEAR